MANETSGLSVQEYQAEIQKLQAELMRKVQEAQARGDFGAIQTLGAEFQTQITLLAQRLQAGMSGGAAAPSAASKPPLYDNSVCALDLDLTVYDGERKMLEALVNDAKFTEVANEILKGGKEWNSRKHLLKKSLHLTEKMAPHLHQIGARCKEILGLKQELDFYVYQDVYFNASCYPAGQNRIYIVVTSALLEKFSTEELTFVLGHEIAHALFNHHRYPAQYLLEEGRGKISALQALRLYSMNRNGEVTADRVGILCAQNFDAAAKAFFKLSSGVTGDSLAFQLHEYIDQFKDLKEELKNADSDPEDWYSSHPFSPLRLKALEIFFKSETYQKLLNRSGGEITEAAMEAEIEGFMSLLEPACLQEGDSKAAEINRRFIFLAGYLIAMANGKVAQEELEALASILDPLTMAEQMQSLRNMDVESIHKELGELAEKLNVMLPTVGKLNVLRDLAIVSYADGSIEESEVQVLYQLCDLLNIRTEFIDNVLESATQEAA